MKQNLIELANENPGLPIMAWVEQEVFSCDDFSHYLANVDDAEVREFIAVEIYGEGQVIYKDNPGKYRDYLYEIHEQGDEDLLIEEINEKVDKDIESINWQKAIFVDVITPQFTLE